MKPEGLKLLIEAGNSIISIETPDEPRATELVRTTADSLALPLFEWTVTTGLREARPQPGKTMVESGKVPAALSYLKDSAYPAIYLFKDLGAMCKDPHVVRCVRDLYFTPSTRLWTLVLIDAMGLPPEIRRLTVPFDVGLPGEDELSEVVRKTFQEAKRRSLVDIQANLTKREMEQLVQTLRGLTAEEAARLVAGAIYDDNVLDGSDLPRVVDAKRNRLGTMGCLESIMADVAPEDIGGLSNLKAWLAQRRGGFTHRAREFGLDPPRGILLLGVQGCGKSLCAKVVASAWRMPLLRMDPGVLYQKFIGESEARLREALEQAESMAPVVLWIDEIEKAFASASAESVDGGLSQRMFGTLLSWMQDHRQPIFIVATANNITQLPPELMRKGRFDEIFFIDLPGSAQRKTIFAVHLRKRRRDPDLFDLDRLAASSEGYSGSEIEQAIVSGMYAAFAAGTQLGTEHILEAIRATQPLSVLMRERVEHLRAWAQNRCVPAD
jgi:AAA+ superfamily predicted ATPase